MNALLTQAQAVSTGDAAVALGALAAVMVLAKVLGELVMITVHDRRKRKVNEEDDSRGAQHYSAIMSVMREHEEAEGRRAKAAAITGGRIEDLHRHLLDQSEGTYRRARCPAHEAIRGLMQGRSQSGVWDIETGENKMGGGAR